MQVEFVTSAPSLATRPELVLPEFAFVGRSNCGKSSLINHFLNRKGMAKTSGQPGKTRLLNYFVVDNRYYLVDLPGYGFAKVSKALRREWTQLMRAYLLCEERPKAVFQLLDVRRDPTDEDRQMHEWIREAELPYALVVTKIDKIGKTKRMARYREIAEAMRPDPDTPFLPTSSEQREGADAMHAWVAALLEAAEE